VVAQDGETGPSWMAEGSADWNQRTRNQIGCGKPGHHERIRPDGRALYRECPDCRTHTA
jgi:hypothetical protein